MKSSEIRSSILLTIFGMAIFTLILFFFYCLPLIKEGITNKSKLEMKKQEYSLQKERIDKVLAGLKDYEKSIADQELISMILPAKEEIPQLINQIMESARLNNLLYQDIVFSSLGNISSEQGVFFDNSVKPQDADNESGKLIRDYSALKIGMDIKGKYGDIKNWLKFVESNMRLMDVSDIDLTIEQAGTPFAPRSAINDSNPSLSAKVSINVYYQPR